MKTTFIIAGLTTLLFSLSATAQETKKHKNPTVDSIMSKYTLAPMPTPMTIEQIFPVIGQYESNNDDQNITITLDEQNKGVVWVDGLPQGRIKASLKRSPAVYKIPAQKNADGKDVPEGTLVYDKDSKALNIIIGRSFNDQDPVSVFTTPATEEQTVAVTKSKPGKTKLKEKKVEPWVFTGTKVEQTTATLNQ